MSSWASNIETGIDMVRSRNLRCPPVLQRRLQSALPTGILHPEADIPSLPPSPLGCIWVQEAGTHQAGGSSPPLPAPGPWGTPGGRVREGRGHLEAYCHYYLQVTRGGEAPGCSWPAPATGCGEQLYRVLVLWKWQGVSSHVWSAGQGGMEGEGWLLTLPPPALPSPLPSLSLQLVTLGQSDGGRGIGDAIAADSAIHAASPSSSRLEQGTSCPGASHACGSAENSSGIGLPGTPTVCLFPWRCPTPAQCSTLQGTQASRANGMWPSLWKGGYDCTTAPPPDTEHLHRIA